MIDLYDVIEVSIQKPHKVVVIDTLKSAKNADAIVNMAVMRRGVEQSFFATARAGQYRDGDLYRSS
jgi:hypothetical protein